jgi:glycosyltransferase involved in cell wall biosynthesis
MLSVHIDTRPDWRGGQNQVLLTLRGLRARGHQVVLLALSGAPLEARAIAEGFSVHPITRRAIRLFAARMLRRLLRERRVHIVHAHDPHALTAAWLARVFRQTALVAHRRILAPIHSGRIALARYRAADRIFAASKEIATCLVDSGIAPSQVEVVYDGIEIPPAVTGDVRRCARQQWKLANGQIVFGCVAYMVPGKGHETLLRALALVRNKISDCHLLLVGDGPLRRDLEKLADGLGASDAVTFTGFVEQLPELFAALDVFVFPACNEGLGSSLLSAMSYGIPCIAARSGAIPEIVDSGVNGILVVPSNAGALAGTMTALAQDREMARQIGSAGRETVENSFSADHMVECTLAKYRQVLVARELGGDFPET